MNKLNIPSSTRLAAADKLIAAVQALYMCINKINEEILNIGEHGEIAGLSEELIAAINSGITSVLVGKIPSWGPDYPSPENIGTYGVAPLDQSYKVDPSYLPSYVDDVIEGYYYNLHFYKDSNHTTLITEEQGKIYVDLGDNTEHKTYRWSGSTYIEVSKILLLGTSTGLAFPGVNGATLESYFANGILKSDNMPTATSSALGGVKVGTTLAISSGTLNLKSGICTTGTYRSVTVDTYGRVTNGTNPTTLSGYGITDVSINNDLITIGNNTIQGITTGVQTFTGNKTFSNDISVNKLTITSTSGAKHIEFSRGNANYITIPNNSNSKLVINTKGIALTIGAEGAYVFSLTGFYPAKNDSLDLGISTSEWDKIYGRVIYENGDSLTNKYLGLHATADDSNKLAGIKYKYGYLYRSGQSTSNAYLIAKASSPEISFPSSSYNYYDASITLFVTKNANLGDESCGILKIGGRLRVTSSLEATIANRQSSWLCLSGDLDPNNFVLTYKLTTTQSGAQVIFKLYCLYTGTGSNTWIAYTYDKIVEPNWGTPDDKWTLNKIIHENSSTDTNILSGIPNDEYQLVSRDASILSTKVLLTATTASTYRPVLLGYDLGSTVSNIPTTPITDKVYKTAKLGFKLSTGELYVSNLVTTGTFSGNTVSVTGNISSNGYISVYANNLNRGFCIYDSYTHYHPSNTANYNYDDGEGNGVSVTLDLAITSMPFPQDYTTPLSGSPRSVRGFSYYSYLANSTTSNPRGIGYAPLAFGCSCSGTDRLQTHGGYLYFTGNIETVDAASTKSLSWAIGRVDPRYTFDIYGDFGTTSNASIDGTIYGGKQNSSGQIRLWCAADDRTTKSSIDVFRMAAGSKLLCIGYELLSLDYNTSIYGKSISFLVNKDKNTTYPTLLIGDANTDDILYRNYNNSTSYTRIKQNNISSNITLELPKQSGQLALEYPIESKTSNFTAELGKYYTLLNVGTLTITLPTAVSISDTIAKNIIFFILTTSSPAVTFSAGSGKTVYKSNGFSIEPNRVYEVNALWNSIAWVLTLTELGG